MFQDLKKEIFCLFPISLTAKSSPGPWETWVVLPLGIAMILVNGLNPLGLFFSVGLF